MADDTQKDDKDTRRERETDSLGIRSPNSDVNERNAQKEIDERADDKDKK